YLIMVYRAKAAGDGTIPKAELFDIMFVFRHPHHFIFSTFPRITKVLFVIYTTAALIYYSKWSRTVFQFVVVSVVV
ncbi:hypothetical protein ACQUFE_18680, partial [Enterococcus casseliflavus]|uniref:hypothetical protein n=1 Tax=Enterococcus casseliflavus TaxID=37734 RepID=UPI003D1333F0